MSILELTVSRDSIALSVGGHYGILVSSLNDYFVVSYQE